MEILYDSPLYRPPSEANSMIFQVTLGCSFNKCSFCNMYRTKEYIERPWDELKTEIELAAKAYPETQRVFLADGDALNLATDKLIQILEYIHVKFTNLKRVSCYAMPKNILQKKDDDLDNLRAAGLDMLYVGIETGNDVLLKKVTKGATSRGIIQSCQKARRHGYTLSCMIILGLGGKTHTNEHIRDTAGVVSEIAPNYLGALTLYLEDEIYNEFMTKFDEPFTPLDDIAVVEELERLISDMNPLTPVIFRANHASNVYSVGGTIPNDKEKLLSLIRQLKLHPEMLKPKILRRF
jgi:coproporphyrinogen III oxidase-like Fe-S oxidoreductase